MVPADEGANSKLLLMLECDLCKEIYDQADRLPRQLPCQHTYCTCCLSRVLAGSTLCCPTCRRQHTTDGADVTSIPKSRLHCELLEVLIKGMSTNSNAPPMCAFCEEEHVVSFCDTCTKSMCDTCLAAHKKQKNTRDHKVRDVDSDSKPSASGFERVMPLTNKTASQNGSLDAKVKVYAKCRQPGHETRDVVQFCQGCRTVVCSDCLVEQHRGHSCINLNKALQSCEDKVNEELERIHDGSEGHSIRHVCDNVLRDRCSIIEFLEKRLQQLYSSYIDVLGEAKDSQLDQLKQYSDKITRELNEIQVQFDSIISRLKAWSHPADGPTRDDLADRIQAGFTLIRELEDLEARLAGVRDRHVSYTQACTTEDFRLIVGALGTVDTDTPEFTESPSTLSPTHLRPELRGEESHIYMDGSMLLNAFQSLTLHCQPESSLASANINTGSGVNSSSITYKKVTMADILRATSVRDGKANALPVSDKETNYPSIEQHGHDITYSTRNTDHMISDTNTHDALKGSAKMAAALNTQWAQNTLTKSAPIMNTLGTQAGLSKMTATLTKSLPPAMRQALASVHIINTARARLALRNLECSWCIEGGNVVVSSSSDDGARRCVESLEKSVEQRVVKFRKESRNVVESDKFIAFREMVTRRFYDMAWLSAAADKDEILVCATCTPVLDDVIGMVRRFLADNVVKTVRLTYPDNVVTFAAKRVKSLSKIKTSFSQFAVGIEVRGSSLEVQGVGVGVALACRQVARLMRKIASRLGGGQDRFDSDDEDDSEDETRFDDKEIALSKEEPISLSMHLLSKTTEIVVNAVCFTGDDVIIYVITGDIIALPVEAVVSPADEKLKHTGGLSKALVKAGGPIIQDECTSHVHQHGDLHPGDVFCSGAGSLPFAAIMHAVSCKWSQGPEMARATLTSAVTGALAEASSKGLSSVAVPALGTGAYKVPVQVSAEFTVQSVQAFLTREPHGVVREIFLCDVIPDTAQYFIAALQTAYTEEDILTSGSANTPLPPQRQQHAKDPRTLFMM